MMTPPINSSKPLRKPGNPYRRRKMRPLGYTFQVPERMQPHIIYPTPPSHLEDRDDGDDYEDGDLEHDAKLFRARIVAMGRAAFPCGEAPPASHACSCWNAQPACHPEPRAYPEPPRSGCWTAGTATSSRPSAPTHLASSAASAAPAAPVAPVAPPRGGWQRQRPPPGYPPPLGQDFELTSAERDDAQLNGELPPAPRIRFAHVIDDDLSMDLD